MEMQKTRGEITCFYLRFCKMYPFAMRKHTFGEAKGYLSEGESLPFRKQKLTFEDQNKEKQNNIWGILENK
jgi:hypothetical protein